MKKSKLKEVVTETLVNLDTKTCPEVPEVPAVPELVQDGEHEECTEVTYKLFGFIPLWTISKYTNKLSYFKNESLWFK